MTLRKVCAWCKAVLEEGDEELTTHGACDPPCQEQIEAGWHDAL